MIVMYYTQSKWGSYELKKCFARNFWLKMKIQLNLFQQYFNTST